MKGNEGNGLSQYGDNPMWCCVAWKVEKVKWSPCAVPYASRRDSIGMPPWSSRQSGQESDLAPAG